MKLVKIDDVWVNPANVFQVQPGENNCCYILCNAYEVSSLNLLRVDKPIDEVVAIINGGLE